MNLETVLKMWQEDSVIDHSSLDETSRKTPALHAKYLELLANAKLRHKKAEMTQKTLLQKKWLYYNGKMDRDQIDELGWKNDPFNGLKVLKGDMNSYYDSDIDIQKSEELIQYYKTLADTLSEIVSNINWRHQTIGNMIKWRMFEAGN